jgi:hypothetical protein
VRKSSASESRGAAVRGFVRQPEGRSHETHAGQAQSSALWWRQTSKPAARSLQMLRVVGKVARCHNPIRIYSDNSGADAILLHGTNSCLLPNRLCIVQYPLSCRSAASPYLVGEAIRVRCWQPAQHGVVALW